MFKKQISFSPLLLSSQGPTYGIISARALAAGAGDEKGLDGDLILA